MTILEETYKRVIEARTVFNAATSEAEKDAARELYNEAISSLNLQDNASWTIWEAYKESRDFGNELLDFSDVIEDENIASILDSMRNLGIEAFTFSSTWSSAVETAWLFQEAGCTLEGMVEINRRRSKAHGYLFRLN